MSAKPVQTLDSVIDSVGKLFSDEATDLFFCSTREVAEQVRSVPNTDKRKHLETCRELFKAGHVSWLEALVELVHGYAEKLVQIAMSYPALVSDDPAKWIRLQLYALLSKHLRQELSLGVLAKQANQRTLARPRLAIIRNIAREIAKLNGTAPDPAPLENQPDHPHTYSRVGAWFRWVAENGPDFDRSESGFHEPWLAPAFVDDDRAFARLKESVTGPDRLTAARTEGVIRRVESRLAGRFDYVLQQVEHKARITLSTNGAVSFTPADKAQRTEPTSPAAQSSPEVHNGASSDRIEAIRRKIAAHPDSWITNQEVAIYYECSVKTIRGWKDTGRLREGPKRGSISNRSIIELDGNKTKNTLRSQ